MLGYYRHIKRPVAPTESDAFTPTLCGLEDRGQYAYDTLGRDERIPSDDNICIQCAERHIKEHYEAQPDASPLISPKAVRKEADEGLEA